MSALFIELDIKRNQNKSQFHKYWTGFNGAQSRPTLLSTFKPFQLYLETKWT